MWLLRLVMLPVGVGIAFYFRSFFRRAAATFGADIAKKSVKLTVWVLAAIMGLLCLDPFGFGAILVLHIWILAMLSQFANFQLRKLCKIPYEKGFGVWKKLYGSGLLPLALTAVVLVAGYCNMRNVVRTDYTVRTRKDVGDGLRVVLVADVHYGITADEEALTAICNDISALDADVLVLCGDLVDSNTTAEGMRTVFRLFGGVDTTYGTFYVYGNHDRPHPLSSGDFTAEELVQAIEAGGITLLQDEAVELGDHLTLVGREDRGYTGENDGRKSMEELLQDADTDRFILTLDHQPSEYAENGSAGTDLLLSGHTHGGQLWPLDLLQQIIPFNDGVYGQIEIDDDTTAIVTSGLAGWGYPIKTAAPAEYAVIDILH